MATQAEIGAGAAALKTYVESISFIEALFAPSVAYRDGAAAIIDAADRSEDRSRAALQAAGEAALRATLVTAGYGDEVSAAQCAAATAAVLAAVARLRARKQTKRTLPNKRRELMQSGIDPRTSMYWNIAFLVLTGIAAGAVDFAGLSQPVADIIKSWAANGAFVISCVNAVLHLFSAPTAGPGAGPGVK